MQHKLNRGESCGAEGIAVIRDQRSEISDPDVQVADVAVVDLSSDLQTFANFSPVFALRAKQTLSEELLEYFQEPGIAKSGKSKNDGSSPKQTGVCHK